MSNPLLEDIKRNTDNESIVLTLPTLGRFYQEGILHPQADARAIEILPLGIAAELHITDPLLVASGHAVPRMLGTICPEVLRPEALCGVDIDAIMLASRIISQGPSMKMKVGCTNPNPVKGDDGKMVQCAQEDELVVDLQEIMFRYSPIEDKDLESYIVPIPELNQVVCMQPPTYQSSMEIIQSAINTEIVVKQMGDMTVEDFVKDEERLSDYEALVQSNVHSSITSLADHIFYVQMSDGTKVADKTIITEWLIRLNREHLKPMRDRLAQLSKGIEELTKVTYKCSACGNVNDFLLTLDPQRLFFYEEKPSKGTTTSKPTSKKKGTTRRKSSRTSQR